MLAVLLVSFTSSYAQIKNATKVEVKVYGNCGMCEKTIEKAGSLKNVAEVDWNKETQMATLNFDANATSKDEILKKIALAGYDNDSFLAPDDVYDNLHGCCQYERVAKTPIKEEMKMKKNHVEHKEMTEEIHTQHVEKKQDTHMEHKKVTSNEGKVSNQKEVKTSNQLDKVYENYFALKDALVKTDATSAAAKAKALVTSINAVKMNEMKMDVHMVWMKVLTELKKDATAISASKDVKVQRASFDTLSESIYKLIKVSKSDKAVYYQHCPMANDGKGANWLSKENTVKNPYYGSMMLSCGKVVETIK